MSLLCNRCCKDIAATYDGQYFMVHDELWNDTCKKHSYSNRAVLCLNCFEELLGRKLTPKDLKLCNSPKGGVVPVNMEIIKARGWVDECMESIVTYYGDFTPRILSGEF